MENINKNIVKVPGAEKSLNLTGLFELIKKNYDSQLDPATNIATDIDNVIRFISENINQNTYLEELKASLFTLYQLRDVFEEIEIGN